MRTNPQTALQTNLQKVSQPHPHSKIETMMKWKVALSSKLRKYHKMPQIVQQRTTIGLKNEADNCLHGLGSGEQQYNPKNADFGPSYSCWSEKFIQENGSMVIALIWTFVSIKHKTFHQFFTSTLSSGSWSSYRPSVPTRAGENQVKNKVVGKICLLGAFNLCSMSERRRRWRERRTGWTCWPSRF